MASSATSCSVQCLHNSFGPANCGCNAGNFLEDGRLNPNSDATKPEPANRPYAPLIRMWPPAAFPVVTTVTLSCPRSCVLFQGDPRVWEQGAQTRGVHDAPRVPFALIETHDFTLSVCVADNNDEYETYVSWDARATDTYDLRLARYHLLRQPWNPAAGSAYDLQLRKTHSTAHQAQGEAWHSVKGSTNASPRSTGSPPQRGTAGRHSTAPSGDGGSRLGSAAAGGTARSRSAAPAHGLDGRGQVRMQRS
jgi:hypothetical protein